MYLIRRLTVELRVILFSKSQASYNTLGCKQNTDFEIVTLLYLKSNDLVESTIKIEKEKCV